MRDMGTNNSAHHDDDRGEEQQQQQHKEERESMEMVEVQVHEQQLNEGEQELKEEEMEVEPLLLLPQTNNIRKNDDDSDGIIGSSGSGSGIDDGNTHIRTQMQQRPQHRDLEMIELELIQEMVGQEEAMAEEDDDLQKELLSLQRGPVQDYHHHYDGTPRPSVSPLPLLARLRQSEILSSRAPLTTVLMYGLAGVGSIVFAELMPLWLLLPPPPHGMGLSLGPSDLGILNSISGVAMLLFNTFCTHRVLNRFGLLHGFRIGAIVMVPLFPLFPQISRLATWPAVSWCLVALGFTMRYVSSQLSFTSVNILVNNSVTARSMGKINGISQSVVALMRACAPLLIGSVFALSVSVSVPLVFDVHFAFYLLSAVHAAMFLLTIGLPETLNAPKTEPYPGRHRQADR